MNLNEKLDNFYGAVISSATEQSTELIKEYKNTLDKAYEERRREAIKKAKNIYRVNHDAIIREKNRSLSQLTLDLRRSVLDKSSEFTEKIFKEVEEKLHYYMESPQYIEFLIAKIEEAYEFARGEDIIIYLNPTDEHLKQSLQEKTGVGLTISNRDFTGGIRAVIPSRTILIDHSFQTKLSEAKSSFQPASYSLNASS